MCRAGVRAESFKNPETDDSRRFRTFLFQLAKTLQHELTHVFVTYIDHGRSLTPGRFLPPLDDGDTEKYKGEAGKWMEYELFGGTLLYMRDPDDKAKYSVCSHLPTLIGGVAHELIYSLARPMLPRDHE